MELEELKKCEFGLTHDGLFHSDDVFAAAFLKIINPDIKIIRNSRIFVNFKGIVFDVGMGEFDHHGSDNTCRDNGIPYAAFGKLWKKYAPLLYGEYVYRKIDKSFVEYLDLSDNTGKSDSLCLAIAAFNPVDKSNGDKEFLEAVDIAKVILEKLIQKEQNNFKEEQLVKEIYEKSEDKKIIVLDEHLHFKDTLPSTEALYVIFPSNRGGYAAQAVSVSSDSIELKKPFPKSWLDKLPSYLNFCHNSRFLITADTIDDLIKACNVAMKEDE